MKWGIATILAGGLVAGLLAAAFLAMRGPERVAKRWRDFVARPNLKTIEQVGNPAESEAWGLKGKVEMPQETVAGGWKHSAGDADGTRYFASTRITPENVQNLEVAWVFRSGFSRLGDTVQSTPVFHDGLLYTVNVAGDVIAVDAATGTERWRKSLPAPAGRRGLTLAAVGDAMYLFVCHAEGVQALHAGDGSPGPFGRRNKSGQTGMFGSELSLIPPAVAGDQLYIAFASGEVAAFDIPSGAAKWRTRLDAGYPNPRLWSGFTYDRVKDRLLVPTGNLNGIDGNDRNFSHDFGCSLVALNAQDGTILWQSQDVVNDVWDLDMLGKPVLITLEDGNQTRRVVYGFSKTGNIHAVDVERGRYLRPGTVEFSVPAGAKWSPEGQATAQPVFSWPEPVSDIQYDLEADLPSAPTNRAYVTHLMRNAKTDLYTRPSVDYDVVLKGLHGGPEWMGGAIDFTTSSLILPINNIPWILRVKYEDPGFVEPARPYKEAEEHDPLQRWRSDDYTYSEDLQAAYLEETRFPIDPDYVRACSSCHGIARQGYYESEFEPGRHVPSLIGFFDKSRNEQAKLTPEYIEAVHRFVKGEIKEPAQVLAKIDAYMREHDDEIKSRGGYWQTGYWQVLRDENGAPATDEPWGYLLSLDLITGRVKWKRPFGKSRGREGSMNFGGVMTTASGLTFATGTTDEKAYAFLSETGEEIWSDKLPHTGSAPPMGFELDGVAYVAFTATGGRFHEFDVDNHGDALVAYRLKGGKRAR